MKKNKRNSLLLFFLPLSVFFLGASFVFAQGKALEIEQYPTFLPQYLEYVLNLLLSLVGLIIFGALVYAGFRYLTAAGNPIKLDDAKKRILAAFLGLVIILSSYLILYTINPRLVIFQVPEWVKVEVPPFSPPPPLEEQTLGADEIPVGKLIDGAGKEVKGGSPTSPIYTYEGVLASTRLERIKKLTDEIWETSKDIQKTSEEIQEISAQIEETAQEIRMLANQCSCRLCETPGCGPPPVCAPRAPCEGDPCAPVRRQLQERQALLIELAGKLPPLKTKLENLMLILEQKSKELKEEQNKLKKALAELEKAEGAMKGCSQFLLNADNFWQYKKGLEDQKIVKGVEIRPIWENIKTGDDAFVFYCLEAPFGVSLEEEGMSWEDLEKELSKIETTESVKVYCGTEIPVGSVIDNTEDIAKRLIDEFQKVVDEVPIIKNEVVKITEEIPKEINNAKHMAELPDQCVPEKCDPVCGPVITCSPEGDCWVSACIPLPCIGVPCPYGEMDRTLAAIKKNHQIITAAYDNIVIFHQKMTEYDDEINNLIAGNEIHDPTKIAAPLPDGMRKPTWAYRIINTEIPDVRIRFGDAVKGCFNTEEDWIRATFEAKVLEKNVLTCEEAKVICWDLPENYQCYGEGDPKAYTNYFCGEAKSP